MNKLALAIGMTVILPLSVAIYSTRGNTETKIAEAATGTLALVANGEDFIRQGFVSKDGWQVDFAHAYITLAEVTAYITKPAFNASTTAQLEPTQVVTLIDRPTTVDLAEGGDDAQPILVTQANAPVGSYNALGWKVVPATEGSSNGNSIILEGTASKDGQTIDFIIGFEQELEYTCGEYVGDERKGIVQTENMAEVETTFHFDHLFGDNSLPAEDVLNQESLGFAPLASLAQNGQLEINQTDLQQQLASKEYDKLQKAILGLGHVGEGHCRS